MLVRTAQTQVSRESSPREDVSCETRKEAFYAIVKALDARVKRRASKQLDVTDRDLVASMMASAEAWLSCKDWLDCLDGVCVEEVPDVMKRLHLWQNELEGISARLHLFEDPTETFVHNHRSNMFSCCLHGSYWHRTWGVDASGSHYAMKRSGQSTVEPKQGGLFIQHANDHVKGACYFIHARTPHTVFPHLDGLCQC